MTFFRKLFPANWQTFSGLRIDIHGEEDLRDAPETLSIQNYLVSRISFTFIPIMILFSLDDLINLNWFDFFPNLLWILFMIWIPFMMRKGLSFPYRGQAIRFLILYTGILIVRWAAIGGVEGAMIHWLYLWPAVTIFVLGRREGIRWNLVMMLVILGLLGARPFPWVYHYSVGELVRFFAAYGVVLALAYFSELIRTHFHLVSQKNLEQATQTAQELAEKNDALEKALNEKSFLVHEIEHRVANNLQMIAGLIHLKADQLETPDVLDDLRGQVATIANVHHKLQAAGVGQRVAMDSYLSEIVQGLLSGFPHLHVSLDCNLTNILLPSRQAVNLGLMTNEITTNAIKYAFSADRQNHFKIDLWEDTTTHTIHLRMGNDGPPIKTDPSNSSSSTNLGLNLVKLLVSQMDGRFEMTHAPHPVFEIAVPAPA